MERPLPSIALAAFTFHAVVGAVIGLALLMAPLAFGGAFGFPGEPGLQPALRAFGAMFLGLGSLTSVLAMRASTWAQVDIIVRGEMAYLALQGLVFAFSAFSGVGPALGNWAFFACSAVLFVLFAAAFAARPK